MKNQSDALAIYSFLLRENIRFIRVCHDRCKTKKEIEKIIYKYGTEIVFPKYRILQDIKTGCFF